MEVTGDFVANIEYHGDNTCLQVSTGWCAACAGHDNEWVWTSFSPPVSFWRAFNGSIMVLFPRTAMPTQENGQNRLPLTIQPLRASPPPSSIWRMNSRCSGATASDAPRKSGGLSDSKMRVIVPHNSRDLPMLLVTDKAASSDEKYLATSGGYASHWFSYGFSQPRQ